MSTYAASILPEFDQEIANTRKVLECVPASRLDWQPNAQSRTIGWNANHLAEILGWVERWLTSPSWDLAPVGGEPYQPPTLTSPREIVGLFNRNAAAARKALASATDAQMSQRWSLVQAGTPIFSMPRAALVRRYILNHLIHHRAILSAYLRMNGVAVPGMYDPTGDV